MDGYTFVTGKNGEWTSTGDSYVHAVDAAGLSSEGIASHFCPHTRTAEAVRSLRILLKRIMSALGNLNASANATTITQIFPKLQANEALHPGCSATEVSKQVMICTPNQVRTTETLSWSLSEVSIGQ
jgi:hypothetical protein